MHLRSRKLDQATLPVLRARIDCAELYQADMLPQRCLSGPACHLPGVGLRTPLTRRAALTRSAPAGRLCPRAASASNPEQDPDPEDARLLRVLSRALQPIEKQLEQLPDIQRKLNLLDRRLGSMMESQARAEVKATFGEKYPQPLKALSLQDLVLLLPQEVLYTRPEDRDSLRTPLQVAKTAALALAKDNVPVRLLRSIESALTVLGSPACAFGFGCYVHITSDEADDACYTAELSSLPVCICGVVLAVMDRVAVVWSVSLDNKGVLAWHGCTRLRVLVTLQLQ